MFRIRVIDALGRELCVYKCESFEERGHAFLLRVATLVRFDGRSMPNEVPMMMLIPVPDPGAGRWEITETSKPTAR